MREVMDFSIYSLQTLLKMAQDAQLISDYEVHEHHVTIAVTDVRHAVTHQTACDFLRTILSDWSKRHSGPTLSPRLTN